MNPNIKWNSSQIQTALLAFVGDIELKLQHILPELPVYILQTGDTSYLLDKKFTEIENKEIYQKVPRFIIGIEDVQFKPEENSNKYNKIIYLFENVPYITSARIMQLMISINTDFVSSNFMKFLENFEISSTIISSENPFTYEFLNMTLDASYNMSSANSEKPTMDVGSSTRNFSSKTSLELHIPLIVPNLRSIKPLADYGFDTIEFGINILDDNDRANLIVTKNDLTE